MRLRLSKQIDCRSDTTDEGLKQDYDLGRFDIFKCKQMKGTQRRSEMDSAVELQQATFQL